MSSIPGIGAVSAALPPATTTPAVAAAGDDSGFASSLAGAVDDLRGLQTTANQLSVAAVTGDLDDIHSAMIASTRAAVTLELVSAVRNKGVDAFNEIMRMQA
ncbi:flagellar hook-basal body complex protein FliE [Microbacterium elymi]|uniref:Flagellar hook-basal body complex protein FliE n=1 Tax=Microbacterium elymi TaxID=2909587 RepID=A0ABY5NLW9_9MICO|nr:MULTISPECIES: flagellar hook-basal body complex protein FliE [Microbacterium]UUT36056.1 flagellar hook-basal body complex protein FliE [Microbacterium elymi]